MRLTLDFHLVSRTFIPEFLNTWTTSFLQVNVEINTSIKKNSGLAKQWKRKLCLEQLWFWQEIEIKKNIAVNLS